MTNTALDTLLLEGRTSERNGIRFCNNITNKTVWDKLADENPTNAVISASNEADAAEKSHVQIEDIKSHLKPGDVLLDLGCGYGRVAQYLLPQMELGGYIGVDSSYTMLSLFKQRYATSDSEQRTPLLLVGADIHSVPIQSGSADVAIACAVFLHNHKDVIRQTIEETKRVLKPGGKLLTYSSFPRAATLLGIQGRLYQMFLNIMGRPFVNGPVRYYSRKEILNLTKDFSEVEIHPFGFTVLPKTIIFLPRFLDNIWRVGIAEPVNTLLEKVTPLSLKSYFASHYDVVVTK